MSELNWMAPLGRGGTERAAQNSCTHQAVVAQLTGNALGLVLHA